MAIFTALILLSALVIPALLVDTALRLYNRVLDALEWRQMRKAHYPRKWVMYQ